MNRTILSLCFAGIFLLQSCNRYTTPIYNDPVFNAPRTDQTSLKQGGEVNLQRSHEPLDPHEVKPREGEHFDDFSKRLLNTLAAQEYQLEQLSNKIEKKSDSLTKLQTQIPEVQGEHVHLRLTLMRVLNADPLMEEEGGGPFKRHIIKDGETLQKISMLYYGTYTGWLAIYRFNRDELVNGPNRIYPGQILFIPIIRDDDRA